jgi:hypothetical protein
MNNSSIISKKNGGEIFICNFEEIKEQFKHSSRK